MTWILVIIVLYTGGGIAMTTTDVGTSYLRCQDLANQAMKQKVASNATVHTTAYCLGDR